MLIILTSGNLFSGSNRNPGALMNLAPLLDATPPIPLHAVAAMSAFVLGVVQLAAPKGTLPHRTIGWIWVCLIVSVAVSSFWIHQSRLICPLGGWMAHRHRIADHRRIMIFTFSGALVIAGLFTLVPGRIMHTVVFGP